MNSRSITEIQARLIALRRRISESLDAHDGPEDEVETITITIDNPT